MIKVKSPWGRAIHRPLGGYEFYLDREGNPHPKHSVSYAYMTVAEARRYRKENPKFVEGHDPMVVMEDGWQLPPLIVTRNEGAVEWLRRRGIAGEIVAHVSDPDQVKDRVVYGVLPFYLASIAAEVVTIDMPGLRQDQRGQDLSPEEMDSAGATLRTYVVTSV